MKYIKKISNIVLILLLIILLTSCGGKSIEPDKLVNVIPYGAEGYGSVRLELNNEYYDELLLKIVNPKKGQTVMEALFDSKANEQLINNVAYLDNIMWEVEGENKNLKNGDTVKVKLSVPDSIADKSKVKLSKDSFDFKIKDLKEAIVFDPFEELVITYEGNDGYGYLLDQEPELPVYGNYFIDKTNNLSNGDKIKVNFEYNQEDSLQMGYVAKTTEKDYVVSGLKELKELKSSELLENVNIVYNGASPFLTATIDNQLDPTYREYIDIYFYSEEEYSSQYALDNLKIGDTIVLYVNASDSLQDVGYKIDNPEGSKEILIDEKTVPQYAKEFDSLTKEQASELKNQALDVIKSAFSDVSLRNGDGEIIKSYTDHKLVGVELLTLKQGFIDNDSVNDDMVNELVFIYSANSNLEDGTSSESYIGVKLPNIIKNLDGEYSYDISKVEHMKHRTGSGFLTSTRYSFASLEEFDTSFFDPLRQAYNETKIDLDIFE